ncbi:hypothetical protein N2603_09525 [Bradyrhizobium huanghuaihaiense]|uniref:hypothetical protein n=1 Tax=Bradyrhizobium huanghuaihaiense TaxID=990078 RepID=UPI0021A9D7B6|nr:hypothetical protein [Bradyrhizobium sp. CB3035]UWU78671.1 hypothetical protein N2603_09525 [Bradyrhizobium sp. CB3035]
MKTLALIVAAVLLLAPASSVQAQTGSSTATKKNTKQPQTKNLPRCSRAMQMSGKPCYGG